MTTAMTRSMTSVLTVVMVMTCLLVNLRHDVAEAISLAPVSWNRSNPIFKTSKNDHVIEVKLYDDIDFVCPYYPPSTSTSTSSSSSTASSSSSAHSGRRRRHERPEFYVVYMVSRAEYVDCNVYDDSETVMMLNCSSPRHRKRFTILFEPFQSIPNVPEYHAGGTYYFITTSTGSRHGMNNLYQGACSHRNMKLTIKVCCESTTKSVKVQSSNTRSQDTVFHSNRSTWKHDRRVTDTQLQAPPGEQQHSQHERITASPTFTTPPRSRHRKPHKTHDNQAGRHRSRTEESNAIENVNVKDLKTAKHTGLIDSCAQCTPLIYVDVIAVMATVAFLTLRHCDW